MASVVKIAATFSFLSPLTILAGVPIAASLRGSGGPGPIDIGIPAFVLVCIPALGVVMLRWKVPGP
jgi:hypothetical protein